MSKALLTLFSVGFLLQAPPEKAESKSSKLHPKLKISNTTQCANCHSTSSWSDITYDHDKTGFPLKGAHVKAACAGCHFSDFKRVTPTNCVACHVDMHAGELGSRCEGCHTEKDWQSLFTADAHRRTNFPLAGRHAMLPCESCHAEAATKRFTRATVECYTCHSNDYDRASAVTIPHAARQFSTNCRECHNVMRWTPSRYPTHEKLVSPNRFDISPGSPHGAMSCRDCHDVAASLNLRAANSANAKCTACHAHNKQKSDAQHLPGPILGVNVDGYAPYTTGTAGDVKCFNCHKSGSYPDVAP